MGDILASIAGGAQGAAATGSAMASGALGNAGTAALGNAASIPLGTSFAGPGALSAAEMGVVGGGPSGLSAALGPGYNAQDILNQALGMAMRTPAGPAPGPMPQQGASPLVQLLQQRQQQQRQPQQGIGYPDYLRLLRGY